MTKQNKREQTQVGALMFIEWGLLCETQLHNIYASLEMFPLGCPTYTVYKIPLILTKYPM